MFTELQQMRQQLPDMEFGRRMAVERELEKVDGIRLTNIIFDETGHFVLYGTMLGIKVINVETNRYVHKSAEFGSPHTFFALLMEVLIGKIKSVYSITPDVKRSNINQAFVGLVPQMCADPRQAGEHSRGPAESVPGGRQGHASGAHRRDEGI